MRERRGPHVTQEKRGKREGGLFLGTGKIHEIILLELYCPEEHGEHILALPKREKKKKMLCVYSLKVVEVVPKGGLVRFALTRGRNHNSFNSLLTGKKEILVINGRQRTTMMGKEGSPRH